MRTSYFIIIGVAALGVVLGVGCSKSSSKAPTVQSSSKAPTVHFVGYEVERDGTAHATVEIANPNLSQIVCQLEVQPKDARSGIDVTVVPARGSLRIKLYVSQTNENSLDLTFFKVVPTSHVTVPMR